MAWRGREKHAKNLEKPVCTKRKAIQITNGKAKRVRYDSGFAERHETTAKVIKD